MPDAPSLWEDLKQRRVVRAVAIYAVVGWGGFEVTETVTPILGAPEWVPRIALIVLLLGFPLVAGLAWAFDVDRSGVQRADSRSPRGRMWLAVAASAILAAGIGVFTLRSAIGLGDAVDLDANTVAVSPFRASVGPDLAYLGEGMVDLLAVRLSEERELRAVDPSSIFAALGRRDSPPPREELARVARSLGAGRLLSGGIVGDARQLTITAELTDVAGTGRSTQAVTGSVDSLPVLVDRLVSQLLSLEAGEREERIGYLSGSPPAAVRDYLRGRTLYRAGDYEGATEAFMGAIRADSTFALAGIALANAAGMTLVGPPGAGQLGQRTAWNHQDRLPPQDRQFLRYFLGSDYPAPRTDRSYIDDAREAEAQFPDRIEAVYLHADAIFHFGQPTGMQNYLGAANEGFRRLLALDPDHAVGLQHRMWIALGLGDLDEARGLAAQMLQRAASTENRWHAALVLGADSITERIHADLEGQSTEALVSNGLASAFPVYGEGADPVEVPIDDISGVLRGRSEAGAVATIAAATELSLGHVDHFREWLEVVRRQGAGPDAAAVVHALAVVFGGLDAEGSAAVVAGLRGGLGVTPSDVSEVRGQCAVAVYDLHLGTREPALRVRDQLEGVSGGRSLEWEAEGCRLLLDAQLAVAAGDAAGPERTAALEVWTLEGYRIFPVLEAGFNLALGRLHLALGDSAAAQQALERCCAMVPGNSIFYHQNALELAEVAVALGDADVARDALSYYLMVRHDPDASQQAARERAQQLLAELDSGG